MTKSKLAGCETGCNAERRAQSDSSKKPVISLLNGEQPPFARYALEVVRTAIDELKSGARDQIFDRARYHHLVRSCDRGDARRDMHRDSANVAANQLTLAGMQPSANLQAQRLHLFAHRAGATHGARRAVEGGKQTVACGVHLVGAERGQFFPQHRVVVAEHLAPSRVTQFGGTFGGPNNVGEHDGGEHPVRFEKSARASYELLDLVCNEILCLLIEHQVI